MPSQFNAEPNRPRPTVRLASSRPHRTGADADDHRADATAQRLRAPGTATRPGDSATSPRRRTASRNAPSPRMRQSAPRPSQTRGTARDNGQRERKRPTAHREQPARLNASFRSGSVIATGRVLGEGPSSRGARGTQANYTRHGNQTVIGQSLAHEHDRRRKAGFGARQHRSALARASIVPAMTIALATALLAMVGLFNPSRAGISSTEESQLLDMPLMGPSALPLSTPRAAWKQGTMPHLYQTDPAWAHDPYGGGTVGTHGCGPTALTMAYVLLTGNTDYTPASMASWAEEAGYAPTGITEWSLFSEGVYQLGLSSTELAPYRSNVETALAAGAPVVAAVAPGDFTSVGHFIVLYGLDGRGNVGVFDPNSPFNSAHSWPINRVLHQTEACWSLATA